MRHSLLISLIVCAGVYARAQAGLDSIPRITEAVSLRPYVGRIVTVVGKIVRVSYKDQVKGKPTFLEMHTSFPGTPFALTIFEDDRKAGDFPPLKETYEGKTVAVTGTVNEHDSAPDHTGQKVRRTGIKIKSAEQIKVQK